MIGCSKHALCFNSKKKFKEEFLLDTTAIVSMYVTRLESFKKQKLLAANNFQVKVPRDVNY